jgi:hypothetical protein
MILLHEYGILCFPTNVTKYIFAQFIVGFTYVSMGIKIMALVMLQVRFGCIGKKATQTKT